MLVADDDEMYPGMEVYLCTCNITILHIILVDILHLCRSRDVNESLS